jgi:hypothetical protein
VSTQPYRASVHAPDVFAPPLWTRKSAHAVVALGVLPIVVVLWNLVFDETCDHQPRPHVALALLVAALTIVSSFGSLKLHRVVAAVCARRIRVRSVFAGNAVASLSVLVALFLTLANVAAAFVVDFLATFHLCLDFSFLGGR